MFCTFAVPAGAAKNKDKKIPAAYAVVAGTVFRDTGASLPGAEVELAPGGNSQAARKVKTQKQVTDARGEFAFRVPAVPAEYRLNVRASGYQGGEKQVAIAGEERQDVFFRLEPASK
ncbi:MAG TPA: carboxypeptidase regulatory-like domain-containing protein [Bryobacteraceae bacterium]